MRESTRRLLILRLVRRRRAVRWFHRRRAARWFNRCGAGNSLDVPGTVPGGYYYPVVVKLVAHNRIQLARRVHAALNLGVNARPCLDVRLGALTTIDEQFLEFRCQPIYRVQIISLERTTEAVRLPRPR